MILTGKCLEAFIEWKLNNKKLSTIEVLDFKHLSNVSKYALIIEFFDSVGIYIELFKLENFIWAINDLYEESGYNNRQEATTEAIKKANEIYNSKC